LSDAERDDLDAESNDVELCASCYRRLMECRSVEVSSTSGPSCWRRAPNAILQWQIASYWQSFESCTRKLVDARGWQDGNKSGRKSWAFVM